MVSKDTCHVWTVFEGMDIAKESDPWSLCEKSCEENLDCLAAFPARHGCFLAVDKTFCEDDPKYMIHASDLFTIDYHLIAYICHTYCSRQMDSTGMRGEKSG